jgi:hypothetical protein
MRPVILGSPVGGTIEDKVEWLVRAMYKIEVASQDIDALTIADNFTVTNLTEDRDFDADSTTLAEVADVLGTLLQDMKDRGSKRTST